MISYVCIRMYEFVYKFVYKKVILHVQINIYKWENCQNVITKLNCQFMDLTDKGLFLIYIKKSGGLSEYHHKMDMSIHGPHR